MWTFERQETREFRLFDGIKSGMSMCAKIAVKLLPTNEIRLLRLITPILVPVLSHTL